MITPEIKFNDFAVVLDTLYRGRINRHVVVDRQTRIPQADFSTYEEAYNFAIFLQEPISVGNPPDKYVRKKVNQVGRYLIIRTVKKRGGGELEWIYLITDKDGITTYKTAWTYKDAFSNAVKLSCGGMA